MKADTLGGRIRIARLLRGLGQRALAAKAGISQPGIARLEKNQSQPSLALAWRLADVLGVKLDDLRPG